MASASIVHGEGFTGVDPNPDLRGRMIRVLAGLREHVDDQLRHGDGLVNAVDLRVVRLRDHGVQTLVVKVNEDGVHPLKGPMDGSVMQVQKSERPPVASLAFDLGDVKHVRQVENVGIEVDAVKAVRDVSRQAGQVRLAHELLDHDVADRKVGDAGIDALRGPVFVPGACSHVFLLQVVHPARLCFWR